MLALDDTIGIHTARWTCIQRPQNGGERVSVFEGVELQGSAAFVVGVAFQEADPYLDESLAWGDPCGAAGPSQV